MVIIPELCPLIDKWHILGFHAVILVSLDQIFWDFYTMFCTTSHRPSWNLVDISFMVPELCPCLL